MAERLLKAWGRAAGHGLAAMGVGLLGAAEAARAGFRRPTFDPGQVEHILVIRLDLLGDVVNSLPTLAALRRHFSRAEITALVLPYAEPLFQAVPGVDRVHALDVHAFRRPAGWRRWRALVDTLRALRAARFDLCLCLHGRVPSVLAALSGARWRVGYAGESYPLAMNLPVAGYRYHLSRHEVECCLDLVRALGLPARAERPRLELPAQVRAQAECVLVAAGREAGRPVVVAHPGSSNGLAKRWPTARWAAWADRVQRDLGAHVTLTGTAADRTLVAEVERQMSTRPLNLAGRTDLLTLAGVCALSAVVVSGDTGPLHLAVATGARVVGLFGPTDPANYAPFAADAIVLQHPVPCGPCYDLRSPADCKLPDRRLTCMWGLEVEWVYRAVERAAQIDPRLPA
ncbi:MAG: glycosyltransferase family 9 protein [Chloroflexi bacterium]|nr:glycosyltransferase family 9 protein [Chloroflexota bacterium]